MDVVRLRAAETCSCSSSAPRTRGWQSRGSSSQLVPARSFRSSAKPPFQLHAARRRDRAVLAAAADAEGHRTISASPTEGKGLGVLRAENSPWDDSTSAEGAVAAVKAEPARPFSEWIPKDLIKWSEPERAPLRVAVLVSGGVDSTVALNLLRAAGHECTAFYLQIWFQEDFRNTWEACPWETDLAYATAACAQLGVPLEVVPLTTQYWDCVVSHSIKEISEGLTPNPDVLCNSRVKFGAFLEYVETAFPKGHFDRVASGHYASIDRSAGPEPRLVRAADAQKDQTYFLSGLTPEQISRASFPLGGLPKPAVRALALAGRLPNAQRKDSQGICFLGKVKFSEFVREHLGDRPGPLVELETWAKVGEHKGFWYHTVGQRQGIGLSGGPWYVVAKDADRNIVYISRNYHDEEKVRNKFRVSSLTWLRPGASALLLSPGPSGDAALPLHVKVRHGARMYRCDVRVEGEGAAAVAEVTIDGSDQGLAAGQYAVFYRGEECLGSGKIQEEAPPEPPAALLQLLEEEKRPKPAKKKKGGAAAGGGGSGGAAKKSGPKERVLQQQATAGAAAGAGAAKR